MRADLPSHTAYVHILFYIFSGGKSMGWEGRIHGKGISGADKRGIHCALSACLTGGGYLPAAMFAREGKALSFSEAPHNKCAG